MSVLAPVEPAYRTGPAYSRTYGPEAVDLAASVDLVLDVNQQAILNDALAIRPGTAEDWNVVEHASICARQNHKTVAMEAIALAKLFVFDDRLVTWTAHKYKTTQEAFLDLQSLVTNYDHLRRRVKAVTAAKGDECIELVSGSRMNFLARTASGGRGMTGDTLFLDEALKLQPAHMAALVPMLSTRSRAQVLYASSAGELTSDVLRTIRDRGRAGLEKRLGYIEWCAPETPCADPSCGHLPDTPGCAMDRVDLWRQANPALGVRISEEFIRETERRALPPVEFARERLGWWQDPVSEGGAIDETAWAALADPKAARGRDVTFAVAVAPDRSWAAVAVAWRRPDAAVQVMLADYRPATAWIAGRVAQLRADWGGEVVVSSNAHGLVSDAEEPSQSEQVEAHTALHDAVVAGTVRHGNEPALNTAARLARWRPYGDGRMFDRKGSADISPLDAAALALHALSSTPDAPPNLW